MQHHMAQYPMRLERPSACEPMVTQKIQVASVVQEHGDESARSIIELDSVQFDRSNDTKRS